MSVHNHGYDPTCSEVDVGGELVGRCLFTKVEPEFPEPETMSPEAERMMTEPTDPENCTCGHDALPQAWHLRSCKNSNRYAPDPVQTPEHYRWIPGVECIDVAQHFGYALGNVIKYVWRADHKGKPIQDLEKALTYLQLELKRRKAES